MCLPLWLCVSDTPGQNESNASEAENTRFLTLSLCCPNGLTLHFQTYVPSGMVAAQCGAGVERERVRLRESEVEEMERESEGE